MSKTKNWILGAGTIAILIVFGIGMKISMTRKSDRAAKDRVFEIADSYEKTYFDLFPEYGLLEGRKSVALDRFSDHSLQALRTWQAQEDRFLTDLLGVDEKKLNGSSASLTYQLLKQTLQGNRAARICRDELWSLSPLASWYTILSIVAEKQPVGTQELRSFALKRWRSVGIIADEEIKNLKEGLKLGYSAPKPVVRRILRQLKIILESKTENSPFFDFAKRDGDAEFKHEVASIIEEIINPSLKRYAHYLETEYLPAARNEIAVSSLPVVGNSEVKCYDAEIARQTTLEISAKEIYDFGLHHMEWLVSEVKKIGKQEFGTEDVAEIFCQAMTNPKYLFHSEEEVLRYNQTALARVTAKLPAFFDIMPKAKGIIKPYPLYRAQTGAPGEYFPPNEDGTSPGIFYINTYEPEKSSRVDAEATLFHELIPGHHFQIALAYENKTLHGLNKYLSNSGFVEGWALYAERLANDMGVYDDNISRLGMLSNEALRTARLVIDPGIHVFHWTREQAIQYLRQHSTLDEGVAGGEIDRYIMHPAQATSYMLGKREIENLRETAKAKLGRNFDIRKFHNQVLSNGMMTLPMLRERIQNWLNTGTN